MSKEIIYAVEDDLHIQQLVKYNLEASGYRVLTFENGENLLRKSAESTPDLFIIDVMLPGMDGLEVCRHLRESHETKAIPIIILTARSEEFDKVLGLELGADDYITKPFSVRELTARVKAILRRVNNPLPNASEVIKHDGINVDCARREVYKNGRLLELSLKEFELLKLLMLNKGKVLSRDMLLEKIWGYDYYGETRTVDVHIRYLRQKIEEDDSNPIYIETVRGIGYKFNDKSVVKNIDNNQLN